MLVRVIKNWAKPDLLRQTPGGKGVWGGITFTLSPVTECDYVIVLNSVPEATVVTCPPEHIWAVMQEPPVREFEWHKKGYKNFHKVITSNVNLNGDRYIFDSLALPWHVDKSYDELKSIKNDINIKLDRASWITSNLTVRSGHRQRMAFLAQIENLLDFDLFGRGFNSINDKWDGLNPYKYSLAVENSNNDYYWTEKIADCFLSWSMPIYYGCPNIDSFFPKESMIKIDIKDPDKAAYLVTEAIRTNAWERNFEAIEYARNLILEKYQFFPFIKSLINSQPKYDVALKNSLPAISASHSGTYLRKLKGLLSGIRN